MTENKIRNVSSLFTPIYSQEIPDFVICRPDLNFLDAVKFKRTFRRGQVSAKLRFYIGGHSPYNDIG